MSAISQFFSGGGGGSAGTNTTGGKSNRLIFTGPVTRTWTAPESATEVEVHCWGGGGNGSANSGPDPRGGGGGGGGYVRHIYPNSLGAISLSITVGGRGETSSVTCPTQSPTSPISATGGSTATTGAGSTGGNGSFTIAPGISTHYTFAASGGAGGAGISTTVPPTPPGQAAPEGVAAGGGGGGGGGSPYGNGGVGAGASLVPVTPTTATAAGGGGGWGPGAGGVNRFGGAALNESLSNLNTSSNASITYNINPLASSPAPAQVAVKWFAVEDIATELLDRGGGFTDPGTAPDSDFGGGSGGSSLASQGVGDSLIAGGGGGGANAPGAGGLGGLGCVIIYW